MSPPSSEKNKMLLTDPDRAVSSEEKGRGRQTRRGYRDRVSFFGFYLMGRLGAACVPIHKTQRSPHHPNSVATQETKEPLRKKSITSLEFLSSVFGFVSKLNGRAGRWTLRRAQAVNLKRKAETYIGIAIIKVKMETATAKPGKVHPSVLEVRFAARARLIREKSRITAIKLASEYTRKAY